MNPRAGLLLILSLISGLGLSFLGFGLMWIGLKPPLQFANSLLFFALTYLLSRAGKNDFPAFVGVAVGALPIGGLFMQFRDKNDSHLFPICIALSWFAGIALGAWLEARRR